MTPKCSECEHCKTTPFADEFSRDGEPQYIFDCTLAGKEIAFGYDVSVLPKTCKRWCQLRKEKK